jgi:alkylhydroperoxidase family enzyme
MSGVIVMAYDNFVRQVSRLPALPDPPSDPVVREMFEDTRRRGGEVINLHRTLAHAPAIMKARRALANALRYEAASPRALRELAIVRTVQIAGGDYELNQHLPMALAAGLTQAQIDAIATWRTSDLFDDRQRALLAYVEAVAQGGEVDDKTYDEFASFFTPQEIVELTTTVVSYYGGALFAKALQIKVDDPGRRTAP